MKIENEREKKKKRKRKEKTISTKPGRIWLHAPPSDRGTAMEIQTLLWMPMLG